MQDAAQFGIALARYYKLFIQEAKAQLKKGSDDPFIRLFLFSEAYCKFQDSTSLM